MGFPVHKSEPVIGLPSIERSNRLAVVAGAHTLEVLKGLPLILGL